MRVLVVLILLGSVVRADVAPAGRYRLDAVGWLELYDGRPPRPRLPSCGQRVIDFIDNFGRVKIDVADDIKVNGAVWKRADREPDGTLYVWRDDLLEGFIVVISFRRDGAIASGTLLVDGSLNDRVRCADGRGLTGKYSH
jgi:hypothetical protein